MTPIRLLAIAAAASVLALPAMAAPSEDTSTSARGTTSQVDPSNDQQSAVSGTASATTPDNVAPAAPAPSDQTYAAPSSANVPATVVTNGPIPDTPENRAKYGQPMSHAGKRTAPAGN